MKDESIVMQPRRRCSGCLLLYLTLLMVSGGLFAQSGTITGSGTVTYNADGTVAVSGSKTFTTHVSGTNESVDNMLQMDVIRLFRAQTDITGGIKARMNQNDGKVTLSIYSYDPSSSSKKGKLLYQVYSQTTSTDNFVGNAVAVPSSIRSGTIQSDAIRQLIYENKAWIVNKTRVPDSVNLFQATMAYLHGHVNQDFETVLNNKLKGNNYKLSQPVIVEVTVKNATLLNNGLKCPGLVQNLNLADYFNASRALSVQVKVNGVVKQTYTAGNTNPTPLNIKMGDNIAYEITYRGSDAPVIEGMPAVWVARFAGDLMYYCTPSVKPGEFNPWIGYDSRVHNMQLRNYKGTPGFKVKVPGWTQSGNIWKWEFTAQRRMNADKVKYNLLHFWVKYKTLKGGAKQRNNQREGLNIQFLEYWQNGLGNSDFKEYQGKAKYVMGFDDDELFYLNSQYHDAKKHPPLAGGGIAKLDSIPSRGMPEGYEQLYDETTGYPSQGIPLNHIISAYRKNREWVVNKNDNFSEYYNGYEIQDLGTDEDHPDGNGTGNNKAPGVIYVRAGGQTVTIKMNVTAPLAQDKGFYGSLEGNRWPAYGENDISYTLTGLQGLSAEELNKFSMSYEGSDALGNLHTQVKNLKDLSASQKTAIASSGKWTASFNNDFPTYSAITAFYQRTPASDKVMIAGKELKPIFLLFFGEKSMEGKGLGAKIWLNDFRDNQTSEYSVLRKFGNKNKYMKPDTRIYTIRSGSTTTFQTWDGDPHLTYDPGIEWFLSSRTLAKRIPDNYLDGTAPGVGTPYLKYYIDGVEQTTGRNGKEFTYTWNTPGTYTLKVVYRVNGGLTTYQHKINVVDYQYANGKIIFKPLTTEEARWLGVTSPNNYQICEITDVNSAYMYYLGPRANKPHTNRWAEHNDYAAQYKWNLPNENFVNHFIDNYNNQDWFWSYWALHYSSNWRDNLPDGLPPYVGNSQVTRVLTTELDTYKSSIAQLFEGVKDARWQYTVPLVSFTDFQGYRMRTNPSCLYDLNYMFNNTNGAFSGNVILPDDPSRIQAPDITDEQKNKMEFYYDLKSGRKFILNIRNPDHLYVNAWNKFGETNVFIAEANYSEPRSMQKGATANEMISSDVISIFPTVLNKNENITICINTNRTQTADIHLYHIDGKEMNHRRHSLSDGSSTIRYNVGSVASGLYLIQVKVNNKSVVKKIMVR